MQAIHGSRRLPPGHPSGPHYLVDDNGLAELRAAAGGDGSPGITWTPDAAILTGELGNITGIPIYLHVCPCDGPTALRILQRMATNPDDWRVERHNTAILTDDLPHLATIEARVDVDDAEADLLDRLAAASVVDQ